MTMPHDVHGRADDRRYFGKYSGVVIDNRAPANGAHLGVVKVRVAGILEDDEGDSARLLEVMAQPCLPPGFFFVPNNGDQVWVEFAAGDLAHAIWVGVWYPSDRRPKTADDGDPTERHRIIRTAGGHFVTLDDQSGAIVIQRGQTKIEITSTAVTIHSTDIKLGSGSAQYRLLTDQALTYLLSHQHKETIGGMTGPPMNPTFVSELFFTRSTKAE
jgi:hypothetical protein